MNFRILTAITLLLVNFFNLKAQVDLEKLKIQNDSLKIAVLKSNDIHNKKKNIDTFLYNSQFFLENIDTLFLDSELLNNSKYSIDTLFYSNAIIKYANLLRRKLGNSDKALRVIKPLISNLSTSNNPDLFKNLIQSKIVEAHTIGEKEYRITQLKLLTDLYPEIIKINDPKLLVNYNFSLGLIYYQYNDTDKALEYLYKTLALKNNSKDLAFYNVATEVLIASCYMRKGEIDKVHKYVKIAEALTYPQHLSNLYLSRLKSLKAYFEAKNGNYKQAYKLLDEAQKIGIELKNDGETLYPIIIKAYCNEMQGNVDKSIELFEYLLVSPYQQDFIYYKEQVLKKLADLYKKKGDTSNAYKTYDKLLDFLNEDKKQNKEIYLEELDYNHRYHEKIYEIEKLKISNENAKLIKDRNQLLIVSLLIIIGLLLSIFIFTYRAYNRKKILAKQEYDLLESKLEEEKQTRVIDDMKLLKDVEERERNRIATDLHDSVGGLLSSVKISLFQFQESNKNLSEDTIRQFDTILSYVDESKQELNRIVYNLTPLIIEKFGLIEAVKQHCKKINASGLKINLQIINQLPNILVDDEITLYRVIQEVLHNVVKHAQASYVLLQIQSSTDGKILITIEDNGKGMTLEKMKLNGGLGMKSLYSRINSLNGDIKIDSTENEGTVIYIKSEPRLSNI